MSEQGRKSLTAAKARLKPFAAAYESLSRAITELPMGELQATMAGAELMTSTNCGWSTYAIAQVILDEGARELRHRLRSSTAPMRSEPTLSEAMEALGGIPLDELERLEHEATSAPWLMCGVFHSETNQKFIRELRNHAKAIFACLRYAAKVYEALSRANAAAEPEPMKLHFTAEQIKRGIENDPDDAEYEAGASHWEALKQRFFVQHGIVHDRKTGKHVRGCDCVTLDGTAEETCALLNALASSNPNAAADVAVTAEAQIKHMVDRFLAWKLPENFHPDAGISFKPTFNDHLPTPSRHEPTGTNLFDAVQAEAMVRYMLEAMPRAADVAVPRVTDEMVEAAAMAYLSRLYPDERNLASTQEFLGDMRAALNAALAAAPKEG